MGEAEGADDPPTSVTRKKELAIARFGSGKNAGSGEHVVFPYVRTNHGDQRRAFVFDRECVPSSREHNLVPDNLVPNDEPAL
jgi:hypothetical protein